MASILKRSGGYQVRYRDPVGQQRARQFKRKVDAERFAREVEVDKDRSAWIDPKGADVPLAVWVETFMAMSVSLSPTTIETYRRDLDKYVLPAFGARRLGQLRAECRTLVGLSGGVVRSRRGRTRSRACRCDQARTATTSVRSRRSPGSCPTTSVASCSLPPQRSGREPGDVTRSTNSGRPERVTAPARLQSVGGS